jgi:hypothetical protein
MATPYEKPRAEDDTDELNERDGREQNQSHEASTSNRKAAEKKVIYLKHGSGSKFTFPFSLAKTWHVCFKILYSLSRS